MFTQTTQTRQLGEGGQIRRELGKKGVIVRVERVGKKIEIGNNRGDWIAVQQSYMNWPQGEG